MRTSAATTSRRESTVAAGGTSGRSGHYVLAPSCVPAVPALEGAGASFTHTEVAELLDSEDVVGVAEIMDWRVQR